MSTDLAAVVLRWAVRRLPSRRAPWGEAMTAELAALLDPAERRRFAAGCALAVLRGPAGLLVLLRWLVGASLLTAAVSLAWAVGVAQARVEALAVIVALTLGFLALRSRLGFGPVAATSSARLIAAIGCSVVAADVMLEFRQLQVDPPLMLPLNATIGVFDPIRTRQNLIELTIVLGVTLVGLARVTAARSSVRTSTLTTAATTAATAAGLWLALTLAIPASAATAAPALLLSAAAVLAAGVLTAGREGRPIASADVTPTTDRRQALIAGLVAAAGATALISLLMDLLPLTGHWVANNAPPVYDTPPPVRVTETVGVVLPWILASLALTVSIRRRPTTPMMTLTSGTPSEPVA